MLETIDIHIYGFSSSRDMYTVSIFFLQLFKTHMDHMERAKMFMGNDKIMGDVAASPRGRSDIMHLISQFNPCTARPRIYISRCQASR